MIKPSSIIQVPTSFDDFFKNWLILLKPFHELTDRQMDLAAAFLKERYELSKVITDETLLDENVMGANIRKKLLEECDIKLSHFYVVFKELCRNKFIVDGRINPRYIPKLSTDVTPESFSIMIYFPFTKNE